MDLLDQLYGAFPGYPPWLILACAVLMLALGLWIAMKLVKWVFYLLILAILIFGGIEVALLIMK